MGFPGKPGSVYSDFSLQVDDLQVPRPSLSLERFWLWLWQPEFDPETKQLRLINKFRGIGDCGFVATYAFPHDGPKLVRLQAKLSCDGKTVPGPEHWDEITP